MPDSTAATDVLKQKKVATAINVMQRYLENSESAKNITALMKTFPGIKDRPESVEFTDKNKEKKTGKSNADFANDVLKNLAILEARISGNVDKSVTYKKTAGTRDAKGKKDETGEISIGELAGTPEDALEKVKEALKKLEEEVGGPTKKKPVMRRLMKEIDEWQEEIKKAKDKEKDKDPTALATPEALREALGGARLPQAVMALNDQAEASVNLTQQDIPGASNTRRKPVIPGLPGEREV